MPEPCELPLIRMPEGRGKLAREIGHRAQMLFKLMDLKGPIFVPTHMGEISSVRLKRE